MQSAKYEMKNAKLRVLDYKILSHYVQNVNRNTRFKAYFLFILHFYLAFFAIW